MTTEPPTPPGRRARPSPAVRHRALGLPGPPPGPEDDETATPGPGFVDGAPGSLREALARIPDLERPTVARQRGAPVRPPMGADLPPAVAGRVPVGAAAPARSVDAGPQTPSAPPAPTGQPDPAGPPPGPAAGALAASAVAAAVATVQPASSRRDGARAASVDPIVAPPGPTGPTGPTGRRTSPPPPPPTWRRVAFGATLVTLVVAIPVLLRTGYRMVTTSTDGRTRTATVAPDEPGYEELVNSTPTAVVLQTDESGRPLAATFLSLSGSAGGHVVFVPMDTALASPAPGIDRLQSVYELMSSDPGEARRQVQAQVAAVLDVGVDELVELDARGWAQVVAPVAPLTFQNPDPVELDGTSVPAGEVTLEADQVGAYLAYRAEGETDVARLYRHQALWAAWLEAMGSAPGGQPPVGESRAGIGLFAGTLATGEVAFSVLPGEYDEVDESLYVADRDAVRELVADAVPAPDPAFPGSRVIVRLLNGVEPERVPGAVVKQVAEIGGSVAVIGNGPSFGRDETTVVYADEARRQFAEELMDALGGTGEVRHDPVTSETVEVTAILGRDVLGDQPPGPTDPTVTTDPGGT